MKRLTDLYTILDYNSQEMESLHNEFIMKTIETAYINNGGLIAKKGNRVAMITAIWDLESIYESISIKDGIDLFQIENGFMLQGYYNGIPNDTNRIYLYFENQKYFK